VPQTVGPPVESFKTHSNYIRAFASLVGAHGSRIPARMYTELATRIVDSGCLPSHSRRELDMHQIYSSMRNAWGTELLINMSSHFISEDELVRVSNNWSAVQAYYVLYHCTQAVAVAKGYARPPSHPKTQRIFCSLWAERRICLEPWTIACSCSGPVNVPGEIGLDEAIHVWTQCSPISAWSIAYKALRTTRDERIEDALGKAREGKRAARVKLQKMEQEERIRRGKRLRKLCTDVLPRLTQEERFPISQKEPSTTLIDYLYRLRIRTNYVDFGMFTDGPEDERSSVQVRSDLETVAGSSLMLAELSVANILDKDTVMQWMNEWAQKNIPDGVDSGLRRRLITYRAMR
jgi:hypothetical protein